MNCCLVLLHIPSWSHLQDQMSMSDFLKTMLFNCRLFQFSLLFLLRPCKLLDMLRRPAIVRLIIQHWKMCCKNPMVELITKRQRLQGFYLLSMWHLSIVLALFNLMTQDRRQDKLERVFITTRNRLNNLASMLHLFISLIWMNLSLSQNHPFRRWIPHCRSLQVEIACLVYRPQVILSMIGADCFHLLKIGACIHHLIHLLKLIKTNSTKYIKLRWRMRCIQKIIPPVVLQRVNRNCLQSHQLNFRQSLFRFFHRNQGLLLDTIVKAWRLFTLLFPFKIKRSLYVKCIFPFFLNKNIKLFSIYKRNLYFQVFFIFRDILTFYQIGHFLLQSLKRPFIVDE